MRNFAKSGHTGGKIAWRVDPTFDLQFVRARLGQKRFCWERKRKREGEKEKEGERVCEIYKRKEREREKE